MTTPPPPPSPEAHSIDPLELVHQAVRKVLATEGLWPSVTEVAVARVHDGWVATVWLESQSGEPFFARARGSWGVAPEASVRSAFTWMKLVDK